MALGLVFLTFEAGSETAVLNPSKDNTLYESSTGDISNGSGMHFFAGVTSSMVGFSIRRGLIAFDIAGAVPAGSVINSVTLSLNMSRTRFVTRQNVTLHRVLADWGEGASVGTRGEGGGGPAATGDATWTFRFFNTQAWNSTGGDFSSASSALTSVGAIGSYTWGSTARMVQDVQDWLNNPASNFGWLVMGNESANTTAKRFGSRENLMAENRPTLTIIFTSPAPTPTPTPTPTPEPPNSAAHWMLYQ